jgi:eukaryotic-like serine/threonine-protein kinase
MAHSFDTSVPWPPPAPRSGQAAFASDVAFRQPEKLAQPVHRSVASDGPLGQIGPWLLESLVYDGTFTRVYRARASHSNREALGRYALKVLHPQWQDHPMVLARLRYEWIVGRAVAHRRIVSILSAHLHRPPYYIAMPWIDARSVAAHLLRHGQMETPVALWIARQAAESLDALHNLGYSHGDVNPTNLLFAIDGHVTLIDLGCARRWDDESMFDEQTISGTPVYLAPEIFAGHPGDPRSDIYSLGITLFEMLAGRPPVSLHDPAEIVEYKLGAALPSVRVFAPHVPSAVAQLVRLLTARDPLRRPQRAREAIQALQRLEIATLAQRAGQNLRQPG